MDNRIDNFIKSVIAYLEAILYAFFLSVVGAVRFSAFRYAVFMRTLFVSDTSVFVSGRSLLMLSSALISAAQWRWSKKNPIEVMLSSDSVSQLLVVSVVMFLSLDLAVLVIVYGPQNRWLGRTSYCPRKAAQRAEILRYLIASYIVAFEVIVLTLYGFMMLRWGVIDIGGAGLLLLLAAILTIVFSVSFVVAFSRKFALLTQLPPQHSSRRLYSIAAGVASSLMLVPIFVFSVYMQSKFASFMAPEEDVFPVKLLAHRCAFSAERTLGVTATFFNTADEWRFARLESATVRFQSDVEPSQYETPVSATQAPAGMLNIAPGSTASFEFRLSPEANARQWARFGKGKLHCALSLIWASASPELPWADSDVEGP